MKVGMIILSDLLGRKLHENGMVCSWLINQM